MKTQFE